MKKLFYSFLLTTIFFSLYVFFFYSNTLEFAIIPKWAIPFPAIASFLRKAPTFFITLLYLFGILSFSYVLYLFTGIIHNRTENWLKTGYFSFVIAITIIYAFIYSLNFYFYPKMIPTNNLIIGCLIFSTIFFSPLQRFKKYVIPYIIFLIAYFVILETYGNLLLLDRNAALVFYPAYMILLHLLIYHFLMNEKLEYYLIVLVAFVPIKHQQGKKYKTHKAHKKTAEYTMIIPSANYYNSSNLKYPSSPNSPYKVILELDSIAGFKNAQYDPHYYLFLLKNLNLNKERINKVKKLIENKDLYIGKIQKQRINDIMERWKTKKETGIITLVLTGEIPDRIGLLKYSGGGLLKHQGTLITNVVDATLPGTDGITIFRNVPPGKYELILLYKKKVPNYTVKIPIIESNNDTVNLGKIEIR
jgi:hypothetical protein